MGSRRWASKPAEITSQVGAKPMASGAITSSTASRYTSPVVPAGSGKFTVAPIPEPRPVSESAPVPG